MCGGPARGSCVKSRCSCLPDSNWTGPSCLAHAGHDDYVWEAENTWADLEFQGPRWGLSPFLVVCLMFLLVAMAAAVVIGAKGEMCGRRGGGGDGAYVPIPENGQRGFELQGALT